MNEQREKTLCGRKIGSPKLSQRTVFAASQIPDASVGNDYNIRTIQDLLGHKSVETTMVYTHVMNKGGLGVKSPADAF